MKLSNLSTSTLLLARQWLLYYSNSTSISSPYAKDAQNMMRDVDKELWGRLISSETPWGLCEEKKEMFEDRNFETTLVEIFKKDEAVKEEK